MVRFIDPFGPHTNAGYSSSTPRLPRPVPPSCSASSSRKNIFDGPTTMAPPPLPPAPMAKTKSKNSIFDTPAIGPTSDCHGVFDPRPALTSRLVEVNSDHLLYKNSIFEANQSRSPSMSAPLSNRVFFDPARDDSDWSWDSTSSTSSSPYSSAPSSAASSPERTPWLQLEEPQVRRRSILLPDIRVETPEGSNIHVFTAPIPLPSSRTSRGLSIVDFTAEELQRLLQPMERTPSITIGKDSVMPLWSPEHKRGSIVMT